jgi:PIN domain nuclease of toxin-antitoxin system
MNIAAVADTHAVLWYIYASPKLSDVAKSFMDNATSNGLFIGVSTISLAEIVYLIEKGRVAKDAYKRLTQKLHDPKNVLLELPVTSQIVDYMWLVPYRDVPDFPDRIIAATAKNFDAPVITRDREIKTVDLKSIW